MSEAKSAVLAAAEREARALDHQETIAVVRLAGESYGMTASQVAEIVRPQEIVEVPNAPEHVEGVNAISGERCSPHPHVYTDRVLRPGDPAFFDILHSYNGYRTCYYRTFAVGSASPAMVDAYKRCRDYMDAAISIVKPGITTADVVKLWPKAEEFGFANEEAAFALQYGHGVGLCIWEKPIFSRLVSLDTPEKIEEGMVFALETYWPASDGWSAARIEEQLVVTGDGCEVITRFPAEEAMVAGTAYYTTTGPLPRIRESQSNKNNAGALDRIGAVVQSARGEGARVGI